ncbi:hypothetical protein R1sor_000968 [Riccia sorocarpa]|uniref:CCHC-type domain-containing protein n=1 Tax=Riccia sorocarpa TaxID=122646 RepID=A0ABD3GYU4_9MARC
MLKQISVVTEDTVKAMLADTLAVLRVPREDCGSQHRGEELAVDPAAARTITDRRHKERSCGDSGHKNEDCPEFISLFREITSGSMQEWMIPDAVGDMDDLDALK